MSDELGLWTGDDGRAFVWTAATGVVAMPAADDTVDTLAARQAELTRRFAEPAEVPVALVTESGEIVEGLSAQGTPGTMAHAAAVARGLGARREL